MTTATLSTNRAAVDPDDLPFEAVRRRLLGADGSITHVGNIGYTFGGGSIGLLARRYGMAAGRPAGRVSSLDCARAVRNVNTCGV